jgi:hypothetical protein
LEFLQTLIISFDPMQFNSQHDGSIDNLVGTVLPGLTSGLLRAEKDSNSSIKQRKVSEFLGWLIQTRPDLCRSRFGSCVTWFVSLADRILIDLDLSAQQKHLRMSSARLLSQAASASDDSFVRAMLSRTGMLDSVLLMLLSNSGSGNMFGSVMQGMICTMAEHWLKSLLAGRASKLLDGFVNPDRFLFNFLILIITIYQTACLLSRSLTHCISSRSLSRPLWLTFALGLLSPTASRRSRLCSVPILSNCTTRTALMERKPLVAWL